MTLPTRSAQVVMKCEATDCGLRFPSPVDVERFGSCPLCESPTRQLREVASAYTTPVVSVPPGLVAVLDNIRSALNVGTMLRSADAGGLDRVHMCGITAPPDNPKVIKSALGAERSVPTTVHRDATQCVAELRASGTAIWALEATPTSELLELAPIPVTPLALIVGNEVTGVDPELLEMADRHVHIGMAGMKTSLNVAVAFGTALWAVRARQGSRVDSR